MKRAAPEGEDPTGGWCAPCCSIGDGWEHEHKHVNWAEQIQALRDEIQDLRNQLSDHYEDGNHLPEPGV
jgi:hypothetical protein